MLVMSSGVYTILGTAVLALLLAGYLGQRYLPPPKPKIVGIDLGTTYSCIGVYHAVTGHVNVIADEDGHQCIPSVVAFSGENILVGYEAVKQAEHNPTNTLYDAKRFIGKAFTKDELNAEMSRYPFQLTSDKDGFVHYVVDGKLISPEFVGSQLLNTLRKTAERNLSAPVTKAVMSVPAEFDERQRNYTRLAARLAGIDVLRVINEPTAAALAYGLHTKEGAHDVLVIDLGGGTLDVSLLDIQSGMFLTRAMAGNNHLGGQDFNERLKNYVADEIEKRFGRPLTDAEDVQSLRSTVEDAKLRLTADHSTQLHLRLHSLSDGAKRNPVTFEQTLERRTFEDINADLFKKFLEPIDRVLAASELRPQDVEEVVLVGGSTRIPKIREMVRDYFEKEPNVSIDPELAVATGVAIQAGIIGGMWPLTVSAIEAPTAVKKIYVQ